MNRKSSVASRGDLALRLLAASSLAARLGETVLATHLQDEALRLFRTAAEGSTPKGVE